MADPAPSRPISVARISFDGTHGGPNSRQAYFFLFGRWVSADAAAVFAAFEDFGLLRTLPAAEAALALVTSEFLRRDIAVTPLFHRQLVDKLCISCELAARH